VLRRILVPFSELFIMLAMMFFALFFVSAALGGRDEDRPISALRLLTLSWKHVPAWPIPEGILPETEPWITSGASFLAATDAENLNAGRWPFAWGVGPERFDYLWSSTSIHGKCTNAPLDVGTLDEFSWKSFSESEEMQPPLALKGLAGFGSDITIGVSTAIQVATEAEVQNDLDVDLGLPVPRSFLFEHASDVNVAFRPTDITRSITIQIVVFLPNPERINDELVRSTVQPVRLEAAQVDLDTTRTVETSVWMDNDLNLWWSDTQRTSGVPEPAPVYHSLGNCEGLRSVRLFAVINAAGVAVFPFDPRVPN